MSPVAKSLQPRNGPQGQYYRAEYDVGVTFGGTELKAFIEWNENVRRLFLIIKARFLMTSFLRG